MPTNPYLLNLAAAAVMIPLEQQVMIVVNVTATKQLFDAAGKTCNCTSGGVCSDPAAKIDVYSALKGFKPAVRDQDQIPVYIQQGEIMVFTDKVVHAGGAGVETRTRRVFGAIPFGNPEHLLDNEVVVFDHSPGPFAKWLDGSLKHS